MKIARANEIERAVFYRFIDNMIPQGMDAKDAFYIGRKVGEMQESLRRELDKEIRKDETSWTTST